MATLRAARRLRESAPKAVLVSEWKTDLGYIFRHTCDLEPSVLGRNGAVLGQHRIADGLEFKKEIDLPRKIFAREIPAVFKQHMEDLFSVPSLAGAL